MESCKVPLLIKKVGLKGNFSYLLFQLMTRAWVLTVTRMQFVIHFAGVFANLVTKVTEDAARVSKWKLHGSLYVSGKLPSYPSPKPTSTLISHVGENVGLGEG